ncbi:MbtH family NRPS accessory protein [Cronobacter turicensis]|nr:MbtH family NRPS accessory protein [Cronobacter turicensis]
MEFSNPFDNPQGRFWLLENHCQQVSLWPEPCALPPGWRVVSPPQPLEVCEVWLSQHGQALQPAHFAHQNETRG